MKELRNKYRGLRGQELLDAVADERGKISSDVGWILTFGWPNMGNHYTRSGGVDSVSSINSYGRPLRQGRIRGAE